jgi:hypothetical protein
MSTRYVPSEVPNNIEELRRFLGEELRLISIAISNLADGHLDKIHVEPNKPRDGDLRYADGTNWNPGGGKNWYWYDGDDATWHKLNSTH